MNEKVKDILWKVTYTVIFGWFGYCAMSGMQRYRDNMFHCAASFVDLYDRVEKLEDGDKQDGK